MHVSDKRRQLDNKPALCVAGRAAPESFADTYSIKMQGQRVWRFEARTRSFEFANLSIGILHISSHTSSLEERGGGKETRSSWSRGRVRPISPKPALVRLRYLHATTAYVFCGSLELVQINTCTIGKQNPATLLLGRSSVACVCVELFLWCRPLLWLENQC